MLKVYGQSDDLVIIEGAKYPDDEIGCFERDVRITFADGTVILVGYSKPDKAVWWIKKEIQGPAYQKLTICEDEDADIYSDIFEIDSTILKIWIVRKEEP